MSDRQTTPLEPPGSSCWLIHWNNHNNEVCRNTSSQPLTAKVMYVPLISRICIQYILFKIRHVGHWWHSRFWTSNGWPLQRWEYFSTNHGHHSIFSIWNHHNCLSCFRSFENLCYGSTTIIFLSILLVRGPSLDVKIWRLQTPDSSKDGFRTEKIKLQFQSSTYSFCISKNWSCWVKTELCKVI